MPDHRRHTFLLPCLYGGAAPDAQLTRRRCFERPSRAATCQAGPREHRSQPLVSPARQAAFELECVVGRVGVLECGSNGVAIVGVQRIEPAVAERRLVREAQHTEQRIVDEDCAQAQFRSEHSDDRGRRDGSRFVFGQTHDRENPLVGQRLNLDVDDDALAAVPLQRDVLARRTRSILPLSTASLRRSVGPTATR